MARSLGLEKGAEGKKSRVLSGMRPTGRLHIGHYFGALQNWVRLQNEAIPSDGASAKSGRSSAAPLQGKDPAYECFYFIADWHALTSDYADTSAIAENTLQIMIDYLAAGLDPVGHKNCVIFQQSAVPEHAELHLLLSMVTPLGWLERVPTYKEALENVKDKDLHNYGFLGYPVLQCADIVIYSSPNISGLFVPTGEDQVSHVETSREIVRRFNGTLLTVKPGIVNYLLNSEHGPGLLRGELKMELAEASEIRRPDEFAEHARNYTVPAVREAIQQIGLE